MHSCKSYWLETNIGTQTKTKSKKGYNSAKIWEWLPILNLTCILQWYILLQTFNKINTSLQMLLSRNQYQDTDKNLTKMCHNMAKILWMITNIEVDLYLQWYIHLQFSIKSINTCESSWYETNMNTPTKTKSKKGHNSAKIWRMIINIELYLYFTVI